MACVERCLGRLRALLERVLLLPTGSGLEGVPVELRDLEAAATPGGGLGGCAAHSYGSWINGTGTCIEHGQAPRATSTRERNGGLV